MKIKVYVSLGLVGCRKETEIEIDESDLEDLSEFEKEQQIEDTARDAMFDLIEWNYEQIREGEGE